MNHVKITSDEPTLSDGCQSIQKIIILAEKRTMTSAVCCLALHLLNAAIPASALSTPRVPQTNAYIVTAEKLSANVR